jgi:hypothetical protein
MPSCYIKTLKIVCFDPCRVIIWDYINNILKILSSLIYKLLNLGVVYSMLKN